jgi:hypothetical protein
VKLSYAVVLVAGDVTRLVGIDKRLPQWSAGDSAYIRAIAAELVDWANAADSLSGRAR